uniref:HDC12497 n=1 Tax=Drosophila melanogaster TaxID=7227 RepID=Q6IKG6_DROME|nr:TPA_inf: HDC12497 [Drosophila melanogaster]
MAQMSGAMGIRLNPNKLRNKARKQGQKKSGFFSALRKMYERHTWSSLISAEHDKSAYRPTLDAEKPS